MNIDKAAKKQRKRQHIHRLIYLLFYPVNRYLDFYYKYYPHIFGDKNRVEIGTDVIIHNAFINVVSGRVTIKNRVFFGNGVSLLTGTHDIQKYDLERQFAVPQSGRDIVIEEGAWVSNNCIVIGPCTIGKNAVVGAGSVVVKDVPPYTVVAGNPAREIHNIDC